LGEGIKRSQNDEEEGHNRFGGDTLPYQRQTPGWDDESLPQGAQSQGAQNMSQVSEFALILNRFP